ncbi:histidine kinase [Streptomyces phaeoluteigriseus]|uniref:histidine kinase n=1 Tax=Streptomyces phaeoluteigriseus TaxID=114686 RepID=A0ABY4Z189_9ACTN|nr:histidine kinase [Streptomyces phaeoluteigriseus]USQ82519.1 histidine kinase [Streptomyces phaeoluteigriseus]
MNGAEERMKRVLRVLGDDLWTLRAAPLPPSVWVRWLPHGLVCLVAAGTALASADQLVDNYRLGAQYGLLCSVAQGVAVVLALWRPVPAWWLSTVVTVLAALGARQEMLSDPSMGAHPWPWTASGVVAQGTVLLLLGLRVPSRVSAEALAVTVFVTWLVQGVIGSTEYQATGVLAVSLFAAVLLLGAALRGRREARYQLVEQAGITAEERARRTLLEERNRIARELHDVVAHHMSVISIQAQVAPHLVENPSDELRENLEGIRKNALEALTELRRVLGVLRSENPEDPYGLGAAGSGATPDAPQPTLDRLDALIDNTRAAGLDVVTLVRGKAPAYPPGMQLSAYRIVQEALSNALRHAPGSQVRVEVTHDRRGLSLEVTNSRPRGPVRSSPGAGHGLLGMRERAVMLGGHVAAHPTLHGGFTVLAFLPKDGTALPLTEDTGPPADLELIFPAPRPKPPTAQPPTGDETR